jgi:hypothetical protein
MPVARLFSITAEDPSIGVFLVPDEKRRRLKVRPEYQSLSCTKCGWFSIYDAAALGVVCTLDPATIQLDVISTFDGHLIVSGRFLDCIADACDGVVTQFPLKNAPSFFLILPKVPILPPDDTPVVGIVGRPPRHSAFYASFSRCNECRRFGDVGFNWRAYRFDEKLVLAGAMLDRRGQGSLISWLCNTEFVAHLKTRGLRGWKHSQ